MVFADASVPQMTFVFVIVVAALTSCFVVLFSMLERSAWMARLRDVLSDRIDQRLREINHRQR